MLLLCAVSLMAISAAGTSLDISIRPGSEAGGLNIRSPLSPGDVFDFRTCEGVVVGSKDFGLFQVKLPATFGDGRKSWRRDGDRWSYSWPYAQGVTVHIVVEPAGDSLKLTYNLQNVGTNALEAVQLHTCIPTTEALGFFPTPTVSPAQTNWSELYGRLHVWSGGRPFSFSETKLAATEPHLSLMQNGAAPVKWGWWVNSPETFDPPLIALASRDGKKTVALAFERAIWASSNTGDDRACFHLFPWFGRIEPGRSVTVRGQLYVLQGGAPEAMKRFRKDFPEFAANASPAHPPYPDVREMIREPLDNVTNGTVACGWEALRYRMRGNIYQSNPGRLDDPRLTQFERLVRGDSEDVAAVNREIVGYCTRKKAEIEAAWRDPKRRHPAKEVCQYQTELIPLAILTLRIGEHLTPEAHQSIKDVLTTFRPEAADVEPTLWMHAPGYNGANAHDYLSFLALTWAVTGNPEVRDAAYWGLRGELDHLNLSGDISEFNVLEAHWCSSNGYDAMKAFLHDPELARMARMIAERLWLNRFLMWSPVVERITGPGSRMAPGAWFGTSGDRLQFATGVEKPIWLNEFFDWGVWKLSATGGRWPLDDVEGMVPDLPAYLQDVAWRKQFPNDLRCSVQLIPWMNRYPKLPGISDARPDPVLGEMVNYQTTQYALGSINHPYEASGCMVYASAWWNDGRAPKDAPLGSPQRFAALYPHYVFNGAAFMDRTELYFENHPDQPLKDDWTGLSGPWMREFAERGRAGVLQHKNTLLYTYSGRDRGADDVRPIADKLHRVSAGMFLFRWQAGLEGIYVNRQPVTRFHWNLSPATGGSSKMATRTQAFGRWKPPTCAVRAGLRSSNARVRSFCIKTTTWATLLTALPTKHG